VRQKCSWFLHGLVILLILFAVAGDLLSNIDQFAWCKKHIGWSITVRCIVGLFSYLISWLLGTEAEKWSKEIQINALKEENRYLRDTIVTSKTILIDSALEGLSKDINIQYGIDFHTARVSFYQYKYANNKESYKLEGRYSANQKYGDKKGSKTHFQAKGIIHEVFSSNLNGYYNRDSPDPRKESKRYVKFHQEHFKLTKKEIQEIRFKARTFIGINLNADQCSRSLGIVLLIEIQDQIPDDQCKTILETLKSDSRHHFGNIMNNYDTLFKEEYGDRMRNMEGLGK
jgi:hypothetical protein